MARSFFSGIKRAGRNLGRRWKEKNAPPIYKAPVVERKSLLTNADHVEMFKIERRWGREFTAGETRTIESYRAREAEENKNSGNPRRKPVRDILVEHGYRF